MPILGYKKLNFLYRFLNKPTDLLSLPSWITTTTPHGVILQLPPIGQRALKPFIAL